MKWIVRLSAVVAAIVALVAAAVLLVPAERLSGIATQKLSQATGRSIEITGDVGLSVWPVLGVTAQGLTIANAAWASETPMLKAETAAIGIEPLAALRGDIRISHIEVIRPRLWLERRADGRANWQLDAPAAPQATTPPEAPPEAPPAAASNRDMHLSRLDIREAALVYSAEGQLPVEISGVDMTLDWPESSAPAVLTVEASPAGSPVVFAATLEAPREFLAGQPTALQADLTSPYGEVAFGGRADMRGRLEAAVTLTTGDAVAFLRSLGLSGVSLPPSVDWQIVARSDVTLSPARVVSLQGLDLTLGDNRVWGTVEIAMAGKPQVTADLTAGDLDLTSVGGQPAGTGDSAGTRSGSGETGTAPERGWSTARIDASALALFDGRIDLRAASIALPDFELARTDVRIQNSDSRMVFTLNDVAAYGGGVTGEFVVNNRTGLSMGGQMRIAGIEMQPLLRDAVDVDRLTGRGDLSLSFLGSGPNVDSIMRSLSGEGSLRVAGGRVLGLDLDRLVSAGRAGGTTIFDDLNATWTIRGGVLRNDDLRVSLTNYSASGAGRINLGARSLDYTLTPVALRANSGEGLAIPVRIRGPWDDVSVMPDVDAALDLRLDAEGDRLEQRARDRIIEELGGSGDDAPEDVIKDRLLRKLFD